MRTRNKHQFNTLFGFAIQTAIIITIAEQAFSGKCPQPEVLYPCTCSEGIDRISCIKFYENHFNSSYTIPQIFKSLSDNLENSEKGFTKLLVANTKVLELGENAFSDITFQEIEIYENNLTRIHSRVFGNGYQTVKKIYINCLTLRNNQQNYSLFEALSSLVNLETVTLELGLDSITQIPNNAFHPINGVQSKLQEINIVGIISSVGQSAFSELPNLRKLKILDQIYSIPGHTFDFNSTSTEQLVIDLSNNKLIGSSFQYNSFIDSKRPIYLNLANNNIRYLDQTVFKPFFEVDSSNKLKLTGNRLVCTDCQSYWVIEQKSSIYERIEDAICHNEKSIWSYDWNCTKENNSCSPREITLLLVVLIALKIYFI